jgi:mannose-6-phosphate isomerase
MQLDYPLRFEPLFQHYLWGGRRLVELFGKRVPEGKPAAESWEVVDHGQEQSRVAFGPFAGQTLQSLVQNLGSDLFGRHFPQTQFPLLFKFLDAHQNLSVQVHPNDAQAVRLTPPDRGKTEAWVVLHAEPHSRIYAGLRPGVDRPTLELSLEAGNAADCLHSFEPVVGDCVFIPAGTVHALGAGLVVAEIQQSSNTTFRLFDWNRLGTDGRPRELHVAAALEVIDFAAGPVAPVARAAERRPEQERLVACDKFVLDRWELAETRSLGGDDRFHLIVVLTGSATVSGDKAEKPLVAGETLLIPAATGSVNVSPADRSVMLDIYLPL